MATTLQIAQVGTKETRKNGAISYITVVALVDGIERGMTFRAKVSDEQIVLDEDAMTITVSDAQAEAQLANAREAIAMIADRDATEAVQAVADAAQVARFGPLAAIVAASDAQRTLAERRRLTKLPAIAQRIDAEAKARGHDADSVARRFAHVAAITDARFWLDLEFGGLGGEPVLWTRLSREMAAITYPDDAVQAQALDSFAAAIASHLDTLSTVPTPTYPHGDVDPAYEIPAAQLDGLWLHFGDRLARYIVGKAEWIAIENGYAPTEYGEDNTGDGSPIWTIMRLGFLDGDRVPSAPARGNAVRTLADLAVLTFGDARDRERAERIGCDCSGYVHLATPAPDPRFAIAGFCRPIIEILSGTMPEMYDD